MRFGNDDFHGLLFLALWMFGMLLCLVGCNPKRSKPKLLRWSTHWVTHWSFLPLCILTTFALLAMSFPRHWEFGSNQFALYLASVQLALSAATNFRSQPGSWQNWNLVVAEMLMPLILFGIWAYPHTDAASGGGEPTTAEISILPNISGGTPTTVPIKIIDGTDAGFYVIKANDSRVRYIPRNLVTSVSFDKPKGWY